MPPRKGANSERNLAKKAAKAAVTEPEPSAQSGKMLARLRGLAQGCVMYEAAPQLVPVLLELKTQAMAVAKSEAEPKKAGEGAKEGAKEGDEVQGDEKEVVPDFEVSRTPTVLLFERLKQRLVGANPLGVFPTSSEALEAFSMMKKLEFDGGPRAKRKGSPMLDRLAANFHDLMPQYLYLLLALMTLRAFLFRSFFACLPWLLLYQFLSVWLPLVSTEPFPLPIAKVPLEKVPLSVRVAATALLHALIWLFFIYELVVRAYWFEWFLIAAGFTGISYVFRPLDA